MAVIFFVFEVVVRIALMLQFVFTVLAKSAGAGALGLFRLFPGIAACEPDSGPYRILNDSAFKFGPDRSAFFRHKKHATIIIATIGKTGRCPVRPVFSACAQNGWDFKTDSTKSFRIIVVPDKSPVFPIPAVSIAFFSLSIRGLKHGFFSSFDCYSMLSSHRHGLPNTSCAVSRKEQRAVSSAQERCNQLQSVLKKSHRRFRYRAERSIAV
jgi:hypothetical protein